MQNAIHNIIMLSIDLKFMFCHIDEQLIAYLNAFN